ncbi:MAG: methyltransferase [Planctomycetota bacterium]
MAPSDEVPGSAAPPMLAVYLPMMRAAAVLAAGELGLFAALGKRTLSPAALAKALRADVHGVRRLADVLVAGGWLVRRHGGYANRPATRRWLTAGGEVDFTAGLAWTREAWRLLPELAAAIRRGGPSMRLWDRMARTPAMGKRFAAYMRAFAELTSPILAKSVQLPRGARRLLDLGGSHGLHAIAFCRAHPGLAAVVFDQRVSLATTPALIREHGMRGRITTQAGDCVRDPIGSGYDVILYFSVAHNQSERANRKVLAKCAAALNPGGLLVIHDYVRGRLPEPYAASFDLTLLLEVGHRTYDLPTFRRWLRDAGLVRCRHVPLAPAGLGSLLVSYRRR